MCGEEGILQTNVKEEKTLKKIKGLILWDKLSLFFNFQLFRPGKEEVFDLVCSDY